MRRYATIYYLLFVLLVMGAFASMAQNAYGLKICGVACLGFALTFLHEIFFTSMSDDDQIVAPWMVYAELICLSVIALVFVFRDFSVDFSFADVFLIFSSTFLFLLFFYQAILQLKVARRFQSMLPYMVALYYGAVLFFVLSILSGIVLPGLTSQLALVAIVLVFIFAVLTLIFKTFRVSEEAISIWQFIRQMKNKSSIVLIASLLVSGYSLLYSVGILPSFYYGTPRGYQQLIELSNAGDGTVGKERPREFKERYDAFITKHTAD